MKYATVCSGVEACSVAWEPLGWQPVFFSEIEDFPSEVLNTHYPSVPNHGDMTNFEEWGYEKGSIDVICGGTPCQSFSVAGLRRGLSDNRGNLALTFCRMVDQLRPKYFIWENVAGCLSSNGGRDFGSITGAMAEFGYSFGWRVFDAQHFGVPQRRRRVFLVGCASGQPEHVRQILFEPKGGRRNSAESQETGQDFARNTRDGTEIKVYEYHGHDSRVKELDQTCQTVTSRWGTGGNNVPLVSSTEKLVRRLTPIEVERLQGFPDDYTNIPWRGKTAPDSRRYKAMGNSMAVPVMRWLGQRIADLEEGNNE